MYVFTITLPYFKNGLVGVGLIDKVNEGRGSFVGDNKFDNGRYEEKRKQAKYSEINDGRSLDLGLLLFSQIC